MSLTHFPRVFLALLGSLLLACEPGEVPASDEPREMAEGEAAMVGDCGACDGGWADPEADVPTGRTEALGETYSDDFAAFLDAEFATYDFAAASGFGGWAPGAERELTRDPVVFIHGNGDQALGGTLGGWTASLEGFRTAGYSDGELYGVTWGPADPAQTSLQYHSREHLERVRAFLLAVLDYTGAEKLDLVSHSMGVTLARKAILGGTARDLLDGGTYDLGSSLADHIDTFVGVAGANVGLASCWYTGPTTPTCGATNGFYPGRLIWWQVAGASEFLEQLNARTDALAGETYAVWSPDDNIIGFEGLVWGQYTARIPRQDGEVRLEQMGHFALRDDWETQLTLID